MQIEVYTFDDFKAFNAAHGDFVTVGADDYFRDGARRRHEQPEMRREPKDMTHAGVLETPRVLGALTDAQIVELSVAFGRYFESESPSVNQVKNAIARTLARWPIGSLGD